MTRVVVIALVSFAVSACGLQDSSPTTSPSTTGEALSGADSDSDTDSDGRAASCQPTPTNGNCSACQVGALVSSRAEHPRVEVEDSVCFCRAVTLAVPLSLPVTRGNLGNKKVKLVFTRADGSDVKCSYKGGSKKAHPETPADGAAGRTATLEHCDKHVNGGDVLSVVAARLDVKGGDKAFGVTEVRYAYAEQGNCGCLDGDGDGACDANDNCPLIANADQVDGDGDALGDACDACPRDAANDADADGVCGDLDNCPIANASQANVDGDAHGDACDPCPSDALDDADHDGACADADNCPTLANNQADLDHDGLGDACDSDADGDGASGADDCDDLNAARYVGATDVPDNGIDEDCDGVDATSGDLPPDPSLLAPPLDRTVATRMFDAVHFLWDGSPRIQQGVAAGTIDELRVCVIRGRVITRNGTPLPGARISVHGAPELGFTLSRADGAFDLAVNGGGLVTVAYEKVGFLLAQRDVPTAWSSYADAPDVALVPRDDLVTEVVLGGDAVVARGRAETDASGTRQATLVFQEGTQAFLKTGESLEPIGTLHVRATEYTVGPFGEQAMPADLPPESGYTYAVELDADEVIEAGADTVVFDPPVAFYVEDFLGAGPGTAIPAGVYEPARAGWTPLDNARTLAIVGETDGRADLDLDGDGLADDASTLGITDGERQRLADLYEPGAVLWRAAFQGFSAKDLNNPNDCPNCPGPGGPTPDSDSPIDDPCHRSGNSSVDVSNQVLKESVPVTGTPWSLHYSSELVRGRNGTDIHIPVTGPDPLPETFVGADVRVSIAGRVFNSAFGTDVNQGFVFHWDGMDAYGRAMQGAQTARVTVTYNYRVPLITVRQECERAFGALFPRCWDVLVESRVPFSRSRTTTHKLLAWDARDLGFGTWRLSAHHLYDPLGQTLFRGDGTRTQAASRATTTRTIFTGGARIQDIVVAPDGSIYLSEISNHDVRRLHGDGTVDVIAGSGVSGSSGDGGLAVDAELMRPRGIALDKAGALFIADEEANVVRRVSVDGSISTVAGTGNYGFSGDGGDALAAELASPSAVLVDESGALYIVDQDNARIRRVAPDGRIDTLVGGGFDPFASDAREVDLRSPRAIAFGPDRTLYIASGGSADSSVVRRLDLNGQLTVVAGNFSDSEANDGIAATDGPVGVPIDLAADRSGAMVILDEEFEEVLQVGADGFLTIAAGRGDIIANDGDPAQSQGIRAQTVAVDNLGRILFARNNTIVRIEQPLPGLSADDVVVPSSSGAEVYIFDKSGRHLRTVDASTGADRVTFAYNDAGLLTSLTDVNGNVTSIEREENGNAGAIEAPFGQRTLLSIDADQQLRAITDPANASWAIEYQGDSGLLVRFENRRGFAASY